MNAGKTTSHKDKIFGWMMPPTDLMVSSIFSATLSFYSYSLIYSIVNWQYSHDIKAAKLPLLSLVSFYS